VVVDHKRTRSLRRKGCRKGQGKKITGSSACFLGARGLGYGGMKDQSEDL